MELVLFALFVTKHFLCDFIFQTKEHIKYKGVYGDWRGMEHSLFHGYWTAAILVVLFPADPIKSMMLGLIDFCVHYNIDYLKVNLTDDLKPDDSRFWMALGLDQLLHYFTYIVIIHAILS